MAAPPASATADGRPPAVVIEAAATLAVPFCRRQGDLYLACVAAYSKGQCQHHRHTFERCVDEAMPQAVGMLRQMAQAMHGSGDASNDLEAAARQVLAPFGGQRPSPLHG
eukprot:TRINITY_DN50913_c0_g1_i1.p2 TRINITY_DN50913_c0_g1~~TRINITY_DN50913_c0_g1_i1.p2  ORF type:complete len:117 (+),score=21.61 TRINITY_DN50913_c0_g1_i1:22-351(+)